MNVTIRVIKYMLMISLLGGSIVFFYPSETYVTFGQIAWYALLGVMFIRPLHDLFPKCKIFSFLLKFRRELGILAGVFGILHGMGAFMEQHKVFEVSYWTLLTDTQYTWNYQTTVFWGILAGLVALPLILTSNHFSTSLLKKNWKRLQRLSYFMIILVAIHIFTIKGEIGGIVFVGLWMILWTIAWKIKRKIVSGQGPKWLCVPCGYIYDESVGDPDSGIAPGTRFEDLPSDWRCPVCGVGKADFVFVEAETIQNTASIVKKEHLTDDVIELTLETKTPLSFRPGQFLSLGLNDDEGDFQRSYSIVEVNGNLVKFLIKIKKTGRAGKWFRNAQIGTQVSYTMATGKFILNQSASPKVFIATGTGLAPIYALLKEVSINISKTLYFSVSHKKDLFYQKELEAIDDLDLHIHITRESVPGLCTGRIDFASFDYPLETEFYICGAGGVLESAQKELQKKGYFNIFFEKF